MKKLLSILLISFGMLSCANAQEPTKTIPGLQFAVTMPGNSVLSKCNLLQLDATGDLTSWLPLSLSTYGTLNCSNGTAYHVTGNVYEAVNGVLYLGLLLSNGRLTCNLKAGSCTFVEFPTLKPFNGTIR